MPFNPPLTADEAELYSQLIEERLDAYGVEHNRIQYLSTSMNHSFGDGEKVFCKLLGKYRDLVDFEADLTVASNKITQTLTTQPLLRHPIYVEDTPLTVWKHVSGATYKEEQLTLPQVNQILNTLTAFHKLTTGLENHQNLPLLNELPKYSTWFENFTHPIYTNEVTTTKTMMEKYLYPMYDVTAVHPSILHADVRATNMIFTPQGPLLCDFESALYGAPEYDYGVFLFNLEIHEVNPTYGVTVKQHIHHEDLNWELVLLSARAKLVKSTIANIRSEKIERARRNIELLRNPKLMVL